MSLKELIEKIAEALKEYFSKKEKDSETLTKTINETKEIVDSTGEDMGKVKDSIQKVKEIVKGTKKTVDETKETVDELFNYLKDEVAIKEKEKSDALNKLKEVELTIGMINNEKKNVDDILIETTNSLKDKEKKLENKKEELKNKQLELEKNASSVIELQNKIAELKDFNNIFKEKKLIDLLNTIIQNPTLKEYQEKNKIIDNSAVSIKNLLLKLYSPQMFVSSYYTELVNYKKEQQEEMKQEEINFYQAINNYFDEKVIVNPNKTKEDGEFDKLQHRGINGETKGTLDNGIILIPSDTTNNDKIKVKIK